MLPARSTELTRTLTASTFALAMTAACERESRVVASPSPTITVTPPPAAASTAATASSPPQETPTPTLPATPDPTPPASVTGDPEQVARVLAEYRRIARFLDKPPAAELSAADTEFLRGYLGAQRFLRYESEGYDTDTIRQAWLEHMSAAAAEGLASTLRIPLRTNVGWGCEVPSIWVATGNFDPNAVFILPEGDTTAVERCEACFELARRERCEEERCSLQVEGHFTGRTTQPTEHCQSTGYYFHIDRATTHGSGDSYFLALPGGAAPPDGPAITEGPRWGVLFATAFRHLDDARARADALQASVVARGHTAAQVLDSRRIPTLWCCSFAVLVERFDQEKDANHLARILKREGFPGAIVRQLY